VKDRPGKWLRRILLGAILWLPAAIVLYLAVFPLLMVVLSDSDGPRARLLYETDHQALLEACRGLSGRVAVGEIKPGEYYIRPHPDPRTRTFPQIILDLDPSAVYIDTDGGITIEMAGGMDHFGVCASPQGYSLPGSVFRAKELIEGLWYYDEGYKERPDDWDKHLDKLRPKANRP
jgi:hypothetical protein